MSKKGSEKPTGRDKHGQTKTVGDREGRGTEKKWKQPRKGKFGGHAMGHCRKILYLAFRRISKKHKEASDFHCCRRQKYLQTKCMERAGPTLFNEYFISNIFFIFSDFLSAERRAWNKYLSFRSSRLRFLTSKQILCLPNTGQIFLASLIHKSIEKAFRSS